MSPLSSPPFPFLFRFQRSKPKPQTGASWGPGTLQPGHWEPASHPFPQLKDSGATRVSSLSLPGWSSRGSSQALGGSQSGCKGDQHFPVFSNQAGLCLPSVAICKDPKDPCSLLPPPISILTHRQTHAQANTHAHAPRETWDLPSPPQVPSQTTTSCHGACSGESMLPLLSHRAWELPLSPQCHGNSCWLPPPHPKGAFLAWKSSKLTAASCHVRASGAPGLGG